MPRVYSRNSTKTVPDVFSKDRKRRVHVSGSKSTMQRSDPASQAGSLECCSWQGQPASCAALSCGRGLRPRRHFGGPSSVRAKRRRTDPCLRELEYVLLHRLVRPQGGFGERNCLNSKFGWRFDRNLSSDLRFRLRRAIFEAFDHTLCWRFRVCDG